MLGGLIWGAAFLGLIFGVVPELPTWAIIVFWTALVAAPVVIWRDS